MHSVVGSYLRSIENVHPPWWTSICNFSAIDKSARSPSRFLFVGDEGIEPPLLTNSSLVFPGTDGHLVYMPNAQGDVIPNFSMVGYQTGDVPLPDTPGGVSYR